MPKTPFANQDDTPNKGAWKGAQQHKSNERQQASDDAKMLIQAAGVCFEKKNFEEAEHLLKQALEIRENAKGSQHRKLTPILNCLGLTYSELGKYQEAEKSFKRGLEIVKNNPRPGKFREIELLESYAKMLRKDNRITEAQQVENNLRLMEKENKFFNELSKHMTPSMSMTALKIMDMIDSDEMQKFELQSKTNARTRLIIMVALLLVLGILIVLFLQ